MQYGAWNITSICVDQMFHNVPFALFQIHVLNISLVELNYFSFLVILHTFLTLLIPQYFALKNVCRYDVQCNLIVIKN